jgi:UDP-N-acetylmuramate dehydrogenase
VIDINDIRQFFRGHIALNEPLHKYTSFRIGGPADYYLEPADKEDAVAIVRYLEGQRTPYLMIGKGSNMLVSDDGVRGAVINLEEGLCRIAADGERVVVEAGLSLARFVDFCIQQGLRGVEMLPGIPGTVGGAVMMNAGAYGGEISDYLETVEVIRNGELQQVAKQDAGFRYRHSNFQGDIIVGAAFRLPRGEKQEIMQRRRELLIKRNRSQPVNYPNSGSMFKNPPGTFAAKLIEEAGLKGKRAGNAQISEKHANFIVNHGNATAEDVLAVIDLAKEIVLKKFNIALELEVRLVGFDKHAERQVGAW